MLNLSAVLEQHVRRRSDAEALVYGDKRLTYAQLNAWANQVANALAASGIYASRVEAGTNLEALFLDLTGSRPDVGSAGEPVPPPATGWRS